MLKALKHLEKDHAYLRGDVFTTDFLEMWIRHKQKEHDAIRLSPAFLRFRSDAISVAAATH